MEIDVRKTPLADILGFRDLFLAESAFQFVYHKCHGFDWADTYLFSLDGTPVGYGSVWGKDSREDRDSIFEFYLSAPFRDRANRVFAEFRRVSGAGFINCQTNDPSLAGLLFEHATGIRAEAILFEDRFQTDFEIPATHFRRNDRQDGDAPQYVLEQHGNTVATGGFVWNYNFPYIDLYYEVVQGHRQQGLGCLIAQELKREAYRLGRVPSARCNVNNKASRATLLKAGMRICGYMLTGQLQADGRC